jgi:hypothetical protein
MPSDYRQSLEFIIEILAIVSNSLIVKDTRPDSFLEGVRDDIEFVLSIGRRSLLELFSFAVDDVTELNGAPGDNKSFVLFNFRKLFIK